MRWGVLDGTPDSASGDLFQDDDLITAALCTELDRLDWSLPTEFLIVRGIDPLNATDRNF